jgi:transcription elongation factor S-II
LAVGKLRMHKAKAVSDLAKEIVKQWKTAVEKAKLKGSSQPVATKSDAGAPTSPLFI